MKKKKECVFKTATLNTFDNDGTSLSKSKHNYWIAWNERVPVLCIVMDGEGEFRELTINIKELVGEIARAR